MNRRDFIKDIACSAAVMSFQPVKSAPARIRFAVIGVNHDHIKGQTRTVLQGGGELVSIYAKEPDLVAAFVAFSLTACACQVMFAITR